MISNDEIKRYAEQYHTAAFIKDDPIQFPRRYTDQRDIEISGYITSYLSYGNRTQILKAAERMDTLFGGHPYDYVMRGKWRDDFKITGDSFYRFTSYADMCVEFASLHDTYKWHPTMESKINTVMMMMNGLPIDAMCKLFARNPVSANKRLNMFLRWMVRKDSPVDIGCWHSMSPASLLIPMDTHVIRMANEWGMLESRSPSRKNAIKLTEKLNDIFPDDPCLGDFALFGYGVEHKRVIANVK